MNRIFVDTSGWGNLVDALQQFHAETKTIYLNAKQNGSRLVTTNYVIAELAALCPVRCGFRERKASNLSKA